MWFFGNVGLYVSDSLVEIVPQKHVESNKEGTSGSAQSFKKGRQGKEYTQLLQSAKVFNKNILCGYARIFFGQQSGR